MTADIDALADTVRACFTRAQSLGPTDMSDGHRSLSDLVAIAKEAEQSLLATRNALSGTQRVRDDYKSRAKAAERLVVRLQVDVETFKQVAHFHADKANRAEREHDEQRASKVLAHQQLDLTEARVAELEGALAGLLPWAGRQTFETDACWVIARDTLAAPDTTDCRHVDNGPSWWWRL